MRNDESDLFFLAKKGDIEAYEKLIESYEKKVYSLILAAVGDRTEASELTQDIFVKVYKDLRTRENTSKISQLIYGETRELLLARCKSSRFMNMNGHGFNMV